MPHRIVGVGPAVDPIPLLPGEHIIFSVHPSLVPLLFLAAVILGIGVGIGYFFLTTDIIIWLGILQYRGQLAMAAFGITLFLVITFFLSWLNTIYTLTDRRVQWEFGILGEKQRSIDVSDIQAVETNQTLLGQIFNFGDIRIRSAQQPIPVDFVQIGQPVNRANEIIAQQP
jgi:uncharacterized membrane protein YdbT with pleckstrin-like domain